MHVDGLVALAVLVPSFIAVVALLRWREARREIDWWVKVDHRNHHAMMELIEEFPMWNWHLDPNLDDIRPEHHMTREMDRLFPPGDPVAKVKSKPWSEIRAQLDDQPGIELRRAAARADLYAELDEYEGEE